MKTMSDKQKILRLKELLRIEKESTPYRLVINRNRAEKLAQLWECCNDLLPEMQKMCTTLKNVKSVLGKMSGQMWDGELVEFHERHRRCSDEY